MPPLYMFSFYIKMIRTVIGNNLYKTPASGKAGYKGYGFVLRLVFKIPSFESIFIHFLPFLVFKVFIVCIVTGKYIEKRIDQNENRL